MSQGKRTQQLRKASLIANSLFASMLLMNCNQASFGGKEFSGNEQNAKDSAKRKDKSDLTDASNNGIDDQAYGTPESPAIDQPGWAGNQIKSLVDALFKNGSLPAIGDDPNQGSNKNSSNNPGGNFNQDQNGSQPGVGGSSDGSSVQGGDIFSDSSGVLWLPCRADGPDAGTFNSEFFAKKGSKVRLAGEFCPQTKITGDVTVLFIIDHSGSMEGSGGEGPNDKTGNGTCGRLKSAELIVKKYQEMGGTNVQAGVVGFSTKAKVQIPVGPIDTVASNLKPEVFCGSDSGIALTNYNAAFTTAETQIATIPGQKIVYFISDGSPTTGGSNPAQSGLQAAENLRKIPGVSLNALFVGYTTGKANNPKGYLETITGNPKLVRVTANAQELVQAAAALATPPITITAADTSAKIENANGTVEVKIDRIEARKDVPNRYYWTTEPFELIGQASKAELNKLTVTAKASTGDTLTSVADIQFNQN
jgi:hypothetical protein